MRTDDQGGAGPTGSYDGAVLGDRFGLDRAPTLLARTASVAPIGFTRLKNDGLGSLRAKDVPHEAAYAFHVALTPVALDLWIDGKHTLASAVDPGATFMFDLAQNPVSELHASFDILRFYISQASLEELACDRRGGHAVGFSSTPMGVHDPVMHGLAMALVDPVEQAAGHNALFIDHIGLAFYAHVTGAYGEASAAPTLEPGQLAPWQLRRAQDFMLTHLEGDPTIAQLAAECGLSAGYFARAFRKTVGVAPHRWLIGKRIERARDLLLAGRLPLADIAIACGFVDQSHFSRVFARREGHSPGKWRRLSAR